MVDRCSTIYISSESCDISAVDSPSLTQLYTTRTLAAGTSLAEQPFGGDHQVMGVAIQPTIKDQTGKLYAVSATGAPSHGGTDTDNVLQRLDNDLENLQVWGPNLTALNIEQGTDMAVACDTLGNLFLLCWVGGTNFDNRVLTLLRINIASGLVTRTWSGLNFTPTLFPATGGPYFVVGGKSHSINMDMISNSRIVYTNGSSTIFRYDLNTGQLPPLVVVPPESVHSVVLDDDDIIYRWFYPVRVLSDGKILASVSYSGDIRSFDVIGSFEMYDWGEIHLYSPTGVLLHKFTRQYQPNLNQPNALKSYQPKGGLAIGETEDYFWADISFDNGSIDSPYMLIHKWQISADDVVATVPIATNFDPDVVTGMDSCQRFPLNRGRNLNQATLIGAT